MEIPLGDYDLGGWAWRRQRACLSGPGEILFYPGGYSRRRRSSSPRWALSLCEQGGTQLAGNHFLRLVESKENLRGLGEMCLWEGAQDILFEHA